MLEFKAALVYMATAIGRDAQGRSVLPEITTGNNRIQAILSIFFAMLGGTALLVLVMAGLRYVGSSGDPNTMTKTKNTIVYSAIGLVVSMAAFAIVSFVLSGI